MRIASLIALSAVCLSLAGCKTKAYHHCVERGVVSHKEMGSYPKMQSPAFYGKDAQEIIESRCLRSTTAY